MAAPSAVSPGTGRGREQASWPSVGKLSQARTDSMGAGREAGPPFLLSPVSIASGSQSSSERRPTISVYVGIDVHRKRSQVAVIDQSGEVLANRNVPNGVEPILKVIGGLPPGTPAAFEAAFGTGWLVELLKDYGFDPHLVHPLQCKAIASARLKNDKVDAAILAQLLRADLLPEAWIAPLEVRQLRALLRHRASLVRLGTGLRNRIHAVAADHGYDRSASYWTGPGRGWLAGLDLPPASREVVADCLAVIDGLAPAIDRIDGELR